MGNPEQLKRCVIFRMKPKEKPGQTRGFHSFPICVMRKAVSFIQPACGGTLSGKEAQRAIEGSRKREVMQPAG